MVLELYFHNTNEKKTICFLIFIQYQHSVKPELPERVTYLGCFTKEDEGKQTQ